MKESIKSGSNPPYRWLTSADQYIGTLVQLCPEIALGRHLAVTSIDSGDPWLTDQQSAADWQCRSRVVYSPRLTTTAELFYQRDGTDRPGYDEWYLFDNGAPDLGEPIKWTENPFEEAHAPRPGRLMDFVNFFAFVLHDPEQQFISNMFWRQLEWVKPESYIADGRDFLTFVSRNADLFDIVYERLKAALSA